MMWIEASCYLAILLDGLNLARGMLDGSGKPSGVTIATP
jgi:hypothetical protein